MSRRTKHSAEERAQAFDSGTKHHKVLHRVFNKFDISAVCLNNRFLDLIESSLTKGILNLNSLL